MTSKIANRRPLNDQLRVSKTQFPRLAVVVTIDGLTVTIPLEPS
ncbi:MAG: hypothetical protein AAGC64_11810 [Bacteroidota bacterium]